MEPVKILVTGFQAFRQTTLNPSAEILSQLQKPHVDTLLLPVSFRDAFDVFKKHWDSQGPYTRVLMLGQAAGRQAVSLERVALNWCESSYADETQYRPELQKPLLPGAPSSYIVDFFPTTWAEQLSQFAPTEVSFSAGTYVCNALYFQVRHFLPPETQALFVHVPLLPEQAADFPGLPTMPLSQQRAVIEELLCLMA